MSEVLSSSFTPVQIEQLWGELGEVEEGGEGGTRSADRGRPSVWGVGGLVGWADALWTDLSSFM